MTLSDADATALLGPKCPDCGWRRDQHRPPIPITQTPACPQWTPADTEETK